MNHINFHWVKDAAHRMIACSEGVAMLAGCDSPQQMLGKRDADLPWADRAFFYHQEDVRALDAGEEVQQLQRQTIATGDILTVLVSKSPLYSHSGKIMGTVGSSIDLTHYFIAKRTTKVGPDGSLMHGDVRLTKREAQVVKLLMFGHTSKTIAKRLNRSPRTIESHINALKSKLSCKNKFDLIRYVIVSGLVFSDDELSNLQFPCFLP